MQAQLSSTRLNLGLGWCPEGPPTTAASLAGTIATDPGHPLST